MQRPLSLTLIIIQLQLKVEALTRIQKNVNEHLRSAAQENSYSGLTVGLELLNTIAVVPPTFEAQSMQINVVFKRTTTFTQNIREQRGLVRVKPEKGVAIFV